MGASLADRPWGEIFPVPELAALIDEALVANSDLRIAAERVELARAQFGIERAAIFPSLVLGVSGSRGRLPGSGPIRNEISEYGDASVVIPAWEIDLWGKLRDRAETRRREMLSSEALVDAARISFVAQVSTLYLELLDFDNQVEITGRTIKTRQYALRLNRLRYDEGVAAIIDVYEAESSLASAEQVLADLIRRRAQLENALSVLLGRNPGQSSGPPGLMRSTRRLVRWQDCRRNCSSGDRTFAPQKNCYSVRRPISMQLGRRFFQVCL